MICQKCGLPKELCICETIAKEAQEIKVYVVEKRFKKKLTVVKGIDVSRINIKALMKKMKSSLACGGTYKNDEIELQGDHRERVKEILIKEGFPREMIEVR